MSKEYTEIDLENQHKEAVFQFLHHRHYGSARPVTTTSLVQAEEFCDIVTGEVKYKGAAAIDERLKQKGYSGAHALFSEGAACRILAPSAQGWQQGKLKIKISLEFYPDEETSSTDNGDAVGVNKTEPSLDQIREMGIS
ncbi:hypothetical protein IFO70_35195 [Phormidium tenue FACHB-886]|nr:hypothetical protein [Phormidium tenue FACHB-886]